MSWAGYDRALPPEMLPQPALRPSLRFPRCRLDQPQASVLDAVQEDAAGLRNALGREDQTRLDEHLSSIRDLERAIATLPPEYRRVDPPESDGDMKDWPKIARLQSDLLVHALASGQTRVASYMLTKCQGLTRFPWLGYTAARHHDYTHRDGKAPGADGPDGQRIMRDICRWHVEEFAYLVGTHEGDAGRRRATCSTVLLHLCPRARRSQRPQEQRSVSDRRRARQQAQDRHAHHEPQARSPIYTRQLPTRPSERGSGLSQAAAASLLRYFRSQNDQSRITGAKTLRALRSNLRVCNIEPPQALHPVKHRKHGVIQTRQLGETQFFELSQVREKLQTLCRKLCRSQIQLTQFFQGPKLTRAGVRDFGTSQIQSLQLR